MRMCARLDWRRGRSSVACRPAQEVIDAVVLKPLAAHCRLELALELGLERSAVHMGVEGRPVAGLHGREEGVHVRGGAIAERRVAALERKGQGDGGG